VGLWHLGSVTAACLAAAGHSVVGLDFDQEVVEGLRQGRPPLFEPGLAELTAKGLAQGNLSFSTDPAHAVSNADIVWVAFDTPVDDDDKADTAFVTTRVERLFPFIRAGAAIVISSQLPVGSTRALAERFRATAAGRRCGFGYSPENLRLGKAISVFSNPDRIIIGSLDTDSSSKLEPFFHSLSPRLVWMGLESAEMTKHAINAFLATSITFANEIAGICEWVGADAAEVARGLKSESRIGPGAYLSPGGPFAGGTLARDIAFLNDISGRHNAQLPLLAAVRPSNDRHREWTQRAISRHLPLLAGRRVSLLGLTYKADTDTLRRSAAVELASWLHRQGATVTAYDPRLQALPPTLQATINLCSSLEQAVAGVAAAIISFDDPAFRSPDWARLVEQMDNRLIIDMGGVLRDRFTTLPGVTYAAVGLTIFAGQEKAQ
jgi:UDPglucose 6-dehydrogenase